MFFKKKCPNCGAKNPKENIACVMCGAPFPLRQMEKQLERRKEPASAVGKMRLLKKIKDLFLKKKDISGERLLEYLKNIGIEAEKIPTYSADNPGRESYGVGYSFSIRLKGLNTDVIRIERYEPESEHDIYVGYRIDYIVRGFGREKWHLKKKLKRLGSSIPSSLLTSTKQKKVYVSPNKAGEYVNIFGKDLYAWETRVVEEGGERVKYRYLKDSDLPSRETLEAYDNIAQHVRRILGCREKEASCQFC